MLLGVLLDAGFSPERAVDAIAVLASFVLGFTSAEAARARRGSLDEQAAHFRSLSPERFPHLIAEVQNLTEDIYAGMVGQLMPLMRAAKGFISHAGGPNPTGGWRVVEIWESEEDSLNWFEGNVEPNLPPGIVPKRTHLALHTAFTA